MIRLVYFNTDDGIWLECDHGTGKDSCMWRHCLGWSATPEDAVAAADLHRKEHP